MKKYTHDLDIKLSIQSKKGDARKLSEKEIFNAVVARCNYLLTHPDEIVGSAGHVESFDDRGNRISRNLF